jgi:hypothetical protein
MKTGFENMKKTENEAIDNLRNVFFSLKILSAVRYVINRVTHTHNAENVLAPNRR